MYDNISNEEQNDIKVLTEIDFKNSTLFKGE